MRKKNYRSHFNFCTSVTGEIPTKKNLHFAFVNLEKAFNRVPRGIVRWAMRKLNVDEWVIGLTMAM